MRAPGRFVRGRAWKGKRWRRLPRDCRGLDWPKVE